MGTIVQFPVVVSERIAPGTLDESSKLFGDMAKVVVDIERGVLALGGELHADGEALLLDDGSDQKNLWGANIYPQKSPTERIEYTSLINIRPAMRNPTMDIQDEGIRSQIRIIVQRLLL